MHTRTLAQLADDLRARRVSATELTRHFLDAHRAIRRNAERLRHGDRAMQALAQAAAADRGSRNGEATPLTGIPLAHKDIFCTAGVKTSCGSRMLDNFIAPYDATIVERLQQRGRRDARQDEHGRVRDGLVERDELLRTGAQSVGSRARARRLVGRLGGRGRGAHRTAATGTDTGGSIRQPAALSGITGLKPTYGRVSRYGMIAFASSLDQAGVLTQTAEDAALLLEAMAGFDARDSTSLDEPVPRYSQIVNEPWDNVTIGVPESFFDDGLDADNATALRAALARAREARRASSKSIELKHIHLSVPAYYVVAPAEASSNLSRFDGVRFGHRARARSRRRSHDVLHAQSRRRLRRRGQAAHPDRHVRAFGRLLRRVLPAGAEGAQAHQRRLSRARSATSTSSPDRRRRRRRSASARRPSDPIEMYLNDIYTIGANLAGLPAMSMPCGFVRNLPVGLQLVAPPLAEGAAAQSRASLSTATDWHQRVPAAYA